MENSKLAMINIISIGVLGLLSTYELIRSKVIRNKTNKRLLALENKVGINQEKAEEAKEPEAN